MSSQAFYIYKPDNISFISHKAAGLKTMYFPLCGVDASGIKSSISPFLSGDIKLDSSRYLTRPASTEDLRHSLRDFFCLVEGRGIVSLSRETRGSVSFIEIGPLWHKLTRRHGLQGVMLEALNFVPVTGENVELMKVTVKNISRKTLKIVPTFSVPLFGRALANKHDHEHVTSLLHRIRQIPGGVVVRPTMLFNEQGHRVNETVYFVFGADGRGNPPAGSFPTMEAFCGEDSEASAPRAVVQNITPSLLSMDALRGKEAVGALRFGQIKLGPGESRDYFIGMGISAGLPDARCVLRKFFAQAGYLSDRQAGASGGNAQGKFDRALQQNRDFWTGKADTIRFYTAEKEWNSWMRWVSLQPVLRRIFGCSFLPDHDYGKGGRGWRDLWQDLLSLILIEPGNIRQALLNNFAGIRIDGSNATIIGAAPGEFIADRNAITRVWMDHGAWPLLTLLLYVHQTGDYAILLEETGYFRDPQLSRASDYDRAWGPAEGNQLKTTRGDIYKGSVLEHVLIQHLVPFFNVGEHNIIRLEDADWNDGLDMASERGESVAFTSLYGGNLLSCADLLEQLARRKGMEDLPLARELLSLLDSISGDGVDYNDVDQKKKLLHERYFTAVQPRVSGEKVAVKIRSVAEDLRRKGHWIFERIKKQEKVQSGRDTWFNGYYDNKGERVEGKKGSVVRMTLTGQVFPIMSGLADAEEMEEIVRAVRRYLKDKQRGGYRLNTDFGVDHYMDLGRAFGFAYGTKENGSFFSHMTVMYAYALYKRGLVREGHEVIRSIYRMCMDVERSRIYPGIPEYFDSGGRGRYHYLTGSASWLVLTLLTQAFGVRGEDGDLMIAPQLVKEEFDKEGRAGVCCPFAGKRLDVTYINAHHQDFGDYGIQGISLEDPLGGKRRGGRGGYPRPLDYEVFSPGKIRIRRQFIEDLPGPCLQLHVRLG